MATRLGFDDAEDVGGAAPPILVIAFRHVPRARRMGRPHVGMERDRLFIEADHRLLRVVRPFVESQDILHAGDVRGVERRGVSRNGGGGLGIRHYRLPVALTTVCLPTL